jgi:hypothetical protein
MVYVHCELTCAHFVSADCTPRRQYSTGEVTEKEYCHARKVSHMMCRLLFTMFPDRIQMFMEKSCIL